MRWRPKQKEAVDIAIEKLENGYDNVLIDAPTGVGKSLICYYIAKHFYENYGSTSFYTTPQVVLLEQIDKDELISIDVIKGRRNYKCSIDAKRTAHNGPCRTRRGFRCYEECEYKVRRSIAMNSPISAMSFAYLIYDRFLPDEVSFGNRDILIVDEGDDIESWAVEFGSFSFRSKNDFNVKDIGDVISWVKGVRSIVDSKVKDILKNDELDDKQVNELDRLIKYGKKLEMFLERVSENPRNWAYSVSGKKLIVEPVDVGDILNELIWCRGSKRVISSATIINKELFTKYTGLSGKSYMIKVNPIFKVENRPVYYWPVAKMTKGERVNGYKDICMAVDKIIDRYYGHRILVHAHSYEIANEIYKRINSDIRVGIHDSSNRGFVMKRFIRGEIDVMISVGFSRGVDLKGDLCRCQIIIKVPYPDVNSPRVRELWVNRKAWNWARYQAVKNLVQASGRVVRSEDDWGHTYILDESFGYLIRYKSQFPKWYLEAVEEIKDVGEVVK